MAVAPRCIVTEWGWDSDRGADLPHFAFFHAMQAEKMYAQELEFIYFLNIVNYYSYYTSNKTLVVILLLLIFT